jgi:hypothetical protein
MMMQQQQQQQHPPLLFCCCCCFQTASSHFQTRQRSSNKLQHCVRACVCACVFFVSFVSLAYQGKDIVFRFRV